MRIVAIIIALVALVCVPEAQAALYKCSANGCTVTLERGDGLDRAFQEAKKFNPALTRTVFARANGEKTPNEYARLNKREKKTYDRSFKIGQQFVVPIPKASTTWFPAPDTDPEFGSVNVSEDGNALGGDDSSHVGEVTGELPTAPKAEILPTPKPRPTPPVISRPKAKKYVAEPSARVIETSCNTCQNNDGTGRLVETGPKGHVAPDTTQNETVVADDLLPANTTLETGPDNGQVARTLVARDTILMEMGCDVECSKIRSLCDLNEDPHNRINCYHYFVVERDRDLPTINVTGFPELLKIAKKRSIVELAQLMKE